LVISTPIYSTPDQRTTIPEAAREEDEYLDLKLLTLPLISGIYFAGNGIRDLKKEGRYAVHGGFRWWKGCRLIFATGSGRLKCLQGEAHSGLSMRSPSSRIRK
jgi:hypothetical protein